jgi:peptidyl-Lys metalloendopeptidase
VLKAELSIARVDGNVLATLSITNQRSMPIKLLKSTILHGGVIRGEAFEVKRCGRRVPYRGLLVKYGEPSEEDFIILEPMQKYETEVNISSVYDMSLDGTYSIRYWSMNVMDSEVIVIESEIVTCNARE